MDNYDNSQVSKVYGWAERETKRLSEEAKADDPESLMKALSVSLIYSFTNPPISKSCSTDIGKLFQKTELRYSGDSSLFEVGCYAYFRIDLWHVQKGLEKQRKKILHTFLIPKFIQVFQDFLDADNLHIVFNNRLQLYGHLIRSEPDRIPFFFTQLILRSADNNKPTIYNFEPSSFPLLFVGINDEFFIHTDFNSFNKIMLPLCFDSISKVYEMLTFYIDEHEQ